MERSTGWQMLTAVLGQPMTLAARRTLPINVIGLAIALFGEVGAQLEQMPMPPSQSEMMRLARLSSPPHLER
jgi:hypothetical protein